MCKLCTKEYNKNYYLLNKEKILEDQKKYYLENKDDVLLRNKKYHKNNPEVVERATRKYRHSEKGKLVYNAKTRNYRARKRNAEGTHTGKEFALIIEAQQHQCFWCGFIPLKLEADHYIPLIKEGTNWINNIVASCRTCNASKQDMLPTEFIYYLTSSSKPVNPILLEKGLPLPQDLTQFLEVYSTLSD